MQHNQAVSSKRNATATMIKVSLLGAISFVLMAMDFAVPIFPSFLKFDIGDIPSLVGGFALGPVAAVMIQLIKNVLKIAIIGSSTGGIGELSNFVIGSSFAGVASLIYQHHKSIKSAIASCLCGTLTMSALGVFSNYFVMLPLYAKLFKMPMEKIVAMGSKINPAIDSTLTLVLYSILPFNILKGMIISILTMLIYKKLSPILKK